MLGNVRERVTEIACYSFSFPAKTEKAEVKSLSHILLQKLYEEGGKVFLSNWERKQGSQSDRPGFKI